MLLYYNGFSTGAVMDTEPFTAIYIFRRYVQKRKNIKSISFSG